MSTIVSKLYTRNIVYIPIEFLIESGIMDSKYLTIEYDNEIKKIILTSISQENASKLIDLESEKIKIFKDIKNKQI